MNENEQEIKYTDSSWIKLKRSQAAFELIKEPREFLLFSYIALRANYKNTNLKGLKVGECFVDYATIGLTRQQYRTSLRKLIEWGYVTKRVTKGDNGKATAVTVANIDIYEIKGFSNNVEQPEFQPNPNQSPTKPQPNPNQTLTTNIDIKNKELKNKDNGYAFVGSRIKLNQKDFSDCLAQYQNLDLIDELTQLDLELRDTEKWFIPMHSKLRYRNNQAKTIQTKTATDILMDDAI